MSDVVAGVAWAADEAYKQLQLRIQGKNSKHKGSVANMSLGGGKSQALDDAVDSAVGDGLHFAVAAGNDVSGEPGLAMINRDSDSFRSRQNKDACSYSPAASKEAITVGATTIGDELAYFR